MRSEDPNFQLVLVKHRLTTKIVDPNKQSSELTIIRVCVFLASPQILLHLSGNKSNF